MPRCGVSVKRGFVFFKGNFVEVVGEEKKNRGALFLLIFGWGEGGDSHGKGVRIAHRKSKRSKLYQPAVNFPKGYFFFGVNTL